MSRCVHHRLLTKINNTVLNKNKQYTFVYQNLVMFTSFIIAKS